MIPSPQNTCLGIRLWPTLFFICIPKNALERDRDRQTENQDVILGTIVLKGLKILSDLRFALWGTNGLTDASNAYLNPNFRVLPGLIVYAKHLYFLNWPIG